MANNEAIWVTGEQICDLLGSTTDGNAVDTAIQLIIIIVLESDPDIFFFAYVHTTTYLWTNNRRLTNQLGQREICLVPPASLRRLVTHPHQQLFNLLCT